MVANVNVSNWTNYPYSPKIDGRATTVTLKRGMNNYLYQPDYSGIADGQSPGAEWFSGAVMHTLNGVKCVKATITAGFDGWGEFGFIRSIPPVLNGECIWVRASLYFPTGFIYDGAPGIKFIRIRNRNPGGTHQGYSDMFITPTTWPTPLRICRETQDLCSDIGNASHNIVFDQWVTYDFGIKLSTVSKASGGADCVHVYRNGELVSSGEAMNTQTTVNDFSNGVFLFTYWNGGCPIKLNNRIGNFVVGQPVTGQTSNNTTPNVYQVDNARNVIWVRDDTKSPFTANELIVQAGSGASGNIAFVEQSMYIKDLRIASYAPSGIL